MLVFAFLLIAFGLGIGTAQQLKLNSFPLRATGTVVDVVTEDTGDGSQRLPVIEFVTVREEKVRFVGRNGLPRHSIGERVVVAYDETRLGEAVVDSLADTWSMSAITAGMGTAILLVLLVVRRRGTGHLV